MLLTFVYISTVMGLGPGPSWQQWGGPGRDFQVAGANLPPDLSRVRTLWKRKLGEGHSGIVVDGGLLYTMYEQGGRQRLVAISRQSGETVWEFGWPSRLRPSYPQYRGPHATPLVMGDTVFAVGIEAKLVAVDKARGTLRWKRDLVGEFGAVLPQSGYAASPIAYRDAILLPVGGPNKRGFAAFARASGDVVWMGHDFQVSHASPILIDTGGEVLVVQNLVSEIVAMDPDDGRLVWRQPIPQPMDNVACTPLWSRERGEILVSHYYDWDKGLRAIRLEGKPGKPKVAWHNEKLAIEFTNMVEMDGVIYGVSGNSAFSLVAVDAADGRLLWRERHPRANLLAAGGRLVVLDESGRLSILRPTRRGVEVTGSVPVLDGSAWTAPTMVGSVLYMRSMREIMAIDLDPS